jgi:hypothetical protein
MPKQLISACLILSIICPALTETPLQNPSGSVQILGGSTSGLTQINSEATEPLPDTTPPKNLPNLVLPS